MPDRKRKRSVPLPRARTVGFATRDQRLPASPPLAQPNYGPGAVLMATVRESYRLAVNRLFGSRPTVLNAVCFAPTTTSTATPTPHDDYSSFPLAKRRRHDPNERNDQVVPVVNRSDPAETSSDDPDSADDVEHSQTQSPSPPSPSSPTSTVTSVPTCNPNVCTCANSLWTAGGIGPDVMLRTAEELSERIILLYARAINPDTNDVDYSSLVHAPDFHLYLSSARKLRYFDPLLLSNHERKAFFLNVYNSLMIHAIAVTSKPRTMFDRISLYNSAAYNIGGRDYSLNMIEHGVLRANRRGCGPFATVPFADGDARRVCALPDVDPRIHFALNCGARSCPAVRFYESSSLDASLDSATRSYLLDLNVDVSKRTVTLPKLLQWYKADFCSDNSMDAVIKWTLPYLSESKRSDVEVLLRQRDEDDLPFKVLFAGYDWTVNDSSQ